MDQGSYGQSAYDGMITRTLAGIYRWRAQTMDLTTVYDCTGAALSSLRIPSGVLMAGYVTGSGAVPWTAAQLAAHPGAIQIDQSPANTPADETADVYDLEAKAGTLDGVPAWVHAAWVSYQTARRPGQRTPTIYASASNITPIVNHLLSVGITNGVNLWVAEQMTAEAASASVTAGSGPFPIVGRQYAFMANYDISVFSTAWLNKVSVKPPVPAPKPGTQSGWHHCNKCAGLFFYAQEAGSHCPAGGEHDGSKSHDYSLPFIA